MKLSVKLLFVVLAMSLMSGCAMNTVYDIGSEQMATDLTGVQLMIEDNRPAEEKEKSYGSFIVGQSDYGIWTLGDESFNPTPLMALKQHVMQAASQQQNRPSQINIDVQHLVIQDNQQAYLLREGSGSLGPLGVAIAEAMHGEKFEFDYDKTRPFVIAFLQANVAVDGVEKEVTLTIANNYASNTDAKGRDTATRKTVDAFFSESSRRILSK